jgi:hypothetical protein
VPAPVVRNVTSSQEPLIVGVTTGRKIPIAPGITGGVRASRDALLHALATPRGRLFAAFLVTAGLLAGYLMSQIGGVLGGPTTSLRVVTMPETGASVAIDGQVRGSAPVELSAIEPGMHVVEVTANGYRSTRQQVQVEEGAAATIVVQLDREE